MVYPAGFLYIFSILYAVTQEGLDITTAQYIFAGILVTTVYSVYSIYKKSKFINPLVSILFIFSKRIHSIFVLRLFNDPIAMLFMYWSILLILKRKMKSAALLFSCALSVKMNVLLFAPGFALIFYQTAGISESIRCALIVLISQLLLGYPFLVVHPSHYLWRSFEFSESFFINGQSIGK